ncbi:MAG: succinylglutamate desuccinylase/aspartoacylase family protein [Alphaproteobacteria bacterium]|nr:succinylglutamate desuccinylase/aspartoacylase family protein [Alphaproteobacteria bacterium]
MAANSTGQTVREDAPSGQDAPSAAGLRGRIPAALRDGVVEGVEQAMRIDSGRPGPHAVIVAIIHGNETCGLSAIRSVLAERDAILRGRITMIAANVAGHARRVPGQPQAGRFAEEDMNRLWSAARLAGDGADTVESRRARAIAPLCRQADLLIDLHSMATAGPRLLMFHDTPAARALLPALPHDHHRVRFAHPVHDGRLLIEQPGLLGEPTRAGFVVECGRHDRPGTDAYARRITHALLAAAGMLPPPATPGGRRPRGRDVIAVEMIRAESDGFRFLRPPEALQRFDKGEVIAEDGARRILAPFAPTYLLLPRLRPRSGGEAGILARDAAA